MTFAALLLSAAVPAGAAAGAEIQRDIVVMGTKLASWQARVRSSARGTNCVTTRSSGDKDIDAVGCSAMTTCIEQSTPRLLASADKRRPRGERKALANAVAEEFKYCTTMRRDVLIAALAERRHLARQGNR